MTPAYLAVEVMRNAIAESQGVSEQFKTAMSDSVRAKQLEAAIKRFLAFNVDTMACVGMGKDWNAEFQYLCDLVGFDPDAHLNEGFDRSDV